MPTHGQANRQLGKLCATKTQWQGLIACKALSGEELAGLENILPKFRATDPPTPHEISNLSALMPQLQLRNQNDENCRNDLEKDFQCKVDLIFPQKFFMIIVNKHADKYLSWLDYSQTGF
jgi:hypothetical protein